MQLNSDPLWKTHRSSYDSRDLAESLRQSDELG